MGRLIALCFGLIYAALIGVFGLVHVAAPHSDLARLILLLVLGLFPVGVLILIIWGLIDNKWMTQVWGGVAFIVAGVAGWTLLPGPSVALLNAMAGYISTEAIDAHGIRIQPGADGFFHPRLTINDVPVDLLLGSASENIVLSHADARRLGFDPAALVYDWQLMSDEEIVPVARIQLATVRLASLTLTDVQAVVQPDAGRPSILSPIFLSQHMTDWTDHDGVLVILP